MSDQDRKEIESIKTDDELVDEASEESFPASDPPSYSGAAAGRASATEGETDDTPGR